MAVQPEQPRVEPAQPSRTLPFFLLTYLFTWAAFFGAIALFDEPARSPGGVFLGLAGTFVPSLVAIGLTYWENGSAGVRSLLSPMAAFQVPGRWYAFAMGYIAILKLASALSYRAITGAWPLFGTDPLWSIPLAILISAPMQAGEEIGWRGFALPRLAQRFGFAGASVLLGIVWGCWHLPLLYMPGHANFGQSFWTFVLISTGLSIAMAWLYVNTEGSLALSMLMHSAVNQTMSTVPTRLTTPGNPFLVVDTSLITLLFLALLWGSGVYFLTRMNDRWSRSSTGRSSAVQNT